MNSIKENSVSVLMCTYYKDNIEHFREAIESLKIQTKYIDELIIIKNGKLSLEHEKIIDEAKSFINIKTKSMNQNLGLAKALNKGLEIASSKWIARFDSDDICCENRFKNMKDKINLYGDEYDVFGTLVEEFNTNKGDLKIIRKVPLDLKQIKKRLIISNPLNHVSVFFKKELFDKFSINNKDFYPLIDGFEDYALWAKLLKNKVNFKNFPIITVFVRTGNNMLKRRGGINYIKNELRFRKFLIRYIESSQILQSCLVSLIRIVIFFLPPYLKKFFYKLKRKYI